jgi:hypothetical protein
VIEKLRRREDEKIRRKNRKAEMRFPVFLIFISSQPQNFLKLP